MSSVDTNQDRENPPNQPESNHQLGALRQPQLASVVRRNIASIEEHRRRADASRTVQERIADAITRIAGSLTFVYFHVIWFSLWILANIGLFGLTPFDPFPYGLLTTIVSLEAIFLSTFVLVSQNRQATIADRRAQLDLQINLLAEHEITTLLQLQTAIARRLEVEDTETHELSELEKQVKPEAVLEKLEEQADHDAKLSKGDR